MATSVCPECKISLEGKDREKHGFSHWGVAFRDVAMLGSGAAERYKALMNSEVKK